MMKLSKEDTISIIIGIALVITIILICATFCVYRYNVVMADMESEEVATETEVSTLPEDTIIQVATESVDTVNTTVTINQENTSETILGNGSPDNPSAMYNYKQSLTSYLMLGAKYWALACEATENTHNLDSHIGWECNIVLDRLCEGVEAGIENVSDVSEDVNNSLLIFYVQLDNGQIWQIMNTEGEACAWYKEDMSWNDVSAESLDYRGALDAE